MIVWPGGIDLAPEPLHEQAKAHPLLAAGYPGRETPCRKARDKSAQRTRGCT
jgi:hypothetical protein